MQCQDDMWLMQIGFQCLKAASQAQFIMLVINLNPMSYLKSLMQIGFLCLKGLPWTPNGISCNRCRLAFSSSGEPARHSSSCLSPPLKAQVLSHAIPKPQVLSHAIPKRQVLSHATPTPQVLSHIGDAMQTGCQCLKGTSQTHFIMFVTHP